MTNGKGLPPNLDFYRGLHKTAIHWKEKRVSSAAYKDTRPPSLDRSDKCKPEATLGRTDKLIAVAEINHVDITTRGLSVKRVPVLGNNHHCEIHGSHQEFASELAESSSIILMDDQATKIALGHDWKFP